MSPCRARRCTNSDRGTLVALSTLFCASLLTSSAPAESGNASATESLPVEAVPAELFAAPAHPNAATQVDPNALGTVVPDPAVFGGAGEDDSPGGYSLDPSLMTESVDPDSIAAPDTAPVQTLALPTGAAKSGVTSQAISVPQGAGKIQGMDESFSAQLSTGIATFSVPFALPSARGKAQPSLGLSYSSSGGFDIAGVGWSLGVPFIARQTDRGIPGYDDRPDFHHNQDRFVFNGGQELVPICVVTSGLVCAGAVQAGGGGGTGGVAGTGGAGGTALVIDDPGDGGSGQGTLIPESEKMPAWSGGSMYFRPRVEGSFLRFFFSPDKQTWRVQSKSGVTMELGVPLDEPGYDLGLETNPDVAPALPPEVFRWHLVRQYDTYGNANPASGAPTPANVVRYRYFQSDGKAYLSDIFDTPSAAGSPGALLESFAHHTRVEYESRTDPTFSYRSGWRIDDRLRVKSVAVASKLFESAAASAPRELVRRYHLSYDAAHHVSLLESVQVEGRCASPAPSEQTVSAGCQDPQGCAAITAPIAAGCLLPPMAFGYAHVGSGTILSGSNGALGGFEEIDDTQHTLANSPPHSLDEALADFFDVNSDALPDVLVTAPALFAGKHGLYFSQFDPSASVGPGGVRLGYAKSSIGVNDSNCVAGLGAEQVDSNILKLTNSNVQPLDLDADGTVNLIHMPRVKKYEIFTPVQTAGKWCWNGKRVATADGQDPKIDFTNDEPTTRVVDVNFDGLVDIVASTGTEMQTFYSLGRYPGAVAGGPSGDGQFGYASMTSATTAGIVNDPVTSCVPWSAQPVRFSDPDIKLGDMNGDGITDIVRVRPGEVRYWPGRGNGYWGTGRRDDCAAGGFGQDRHIAMATSPQFGVVEGSAFMLDDANGDGLDDVVEVRFNNVDIYLNIDGVSWTERHILWNTPPKAPHAERVRMVDVDGSGTRDVVWGDGYAYKYIDLQGGTRPWMLTSVDNGLGKTTAIDYSTSVAEMLAAEAPGGEPAWTKKMPTVAHVVKRVTESDNITVAGNAPGVYVTEYTYRDPVFEGRQREFRGFSSATVKRIGDANSPTDVTTSNFLLGECIDEVTHVPCPIQDRWKDNPREALKGLPFLTEKSNGGATFLSTEHMGYRLRTLYTGLDGRLVRHAFESTMQRYLYDTGPFTSGAAAASAVPATVELEHTPGAVTPDTPASVTLRATAGTARIDLSYRVDYFGNRTEAIASGCTGGSACPTPDETITTTTLAARATPTEPTGWLWRTERSFVTGSAPDHVAQPPRNDTSISYNAEGDPLQTLAVLAGSLPLLRSHETGGAIALPPATASPPTAPIPVSQQIYDPLGNLTKELAPNGRCRTIAYDPAFSHLPITETIATAGNTASGMGAGFSEGNCGLAALTRSATYDRGFELVTTATDMQLQPTAVAYDGFGRLSSLTRPNPEGLGLSPAPSVLVDYRLPPDLGPGAHHSIIHTKAQDGDSVLDGANYLESYTYIDGLGRTIVTLNEADTSAEDGGAFIATGLVEYDNKSAVRRKYLEHFTSDAPFAFDFASPRDVPYGRQRYDAFGRQLQTFDLDGTVTLQSRYHALSTDLSDAADLQPGPHQGTFASERKDGHGRTVEVTERFDDDSGMERRVVETKYLPTGEPEVITRKNLDRAGTDPVVRWLRYDSLGRMVLNVEPNTSPDFTDVHTVADVSTLRAWRYAYNDFGDLVGTSEARGCGVNYAYDGSGRLRLEDYSPCESQHRPYTLPRISPGSPRGMEVFYHYDTAPPTPYPGLPRPPAANLRIIDQAFFKGRLVAVWDLGSATWSSYDGRGRVIATAVRAIRPGPAANILSGRYTSRWYSRAFAYDAADREIAATTGSTVTQLRGAPVTRGTVTGRSVVTTTYSHRGTVQSVGGSYDAASAGANQSLVRRIDRQADGLLSEIIYGDAASTTTAFSYDDRRRLRSVQTYRGPPEIWSGTSYTPVPDPDGPPNTFQLLLQDEDFTYDVVNNPIEIRDWRSPDEWPDGAKPVTKKIQYDDLYRVSRLDYEYASGDDTWTSPFDRENREATDPLVEPDPRRAQPSPHVSFDKRIQTQTWEYDWLGNTRKTDDDAQGFYDRSLGAIGNGASAAGPYQLRNASQPGARGGALTTAYDAVGNLTSMAVRRDGPCLPTSAAVTSLCSQRFVYEWDEVGRLDRARRWDLASPGVATDPEPAGLPAADLRYAYDGADQRVLKTAVDDAGVESHTVYLFATLELRRAAFGGANYTRNRDTEVPYLFANGKRLARVVDDTRGVPAVPGQATRHVLFELGDHLGSTSAVLDQATGELVERATFMAYGGKESDYRPERWGGFREDYGFTGKEEDVEVGLQYFGKRFLSPYLGRWVSADPLGVHGLGGGLNVYAYVDGRALKNVDPLGLQPTDDVPATTTTDPETGVDTHDFAPVDIVGETTTASQADTPPPCSSNCHTAAADLPINNEEALVWWLVGESSPQSVPLGPIERLAAAAQSDDVDVRVETQISLVGLGFSPIPYFGDYPAAFGSIVIFGVDPSTEKLGDVILDGAGALLPGMMAAGSARRVDRLLDAAETVFNKHHTIPREILKQLPPDVAKAVRGKAGAPNRWSIPEDVHKAIHKGPGGGAYNEAFKQRLGSLGRDPTAAEVMGIRDALVKQFEVEQFRP